MNKFGKSKKTRLSKVYFVWTIRDFGSAECMSLFYFSSSSLGWRKRSSWAGFQSFLQAIEAEDTEGRIEIHIYLTAKIEYVLLYPGPFFAFSIHAIIEVRYRGLDCDFCLETTTDSQ